VLDKKERAANPTGHWKDGLIATGYTSCEQKIILDRMTMNIRMMRKFKMEKEEFYNIVATTKRKKNCR
jgi:hypothetical protein